MVQNLAILESFKTMGDPNSTPDEFVVELQELLKKLKIGILKVEKPDFINKFINGYNIATDSIF